MESLFIILLSLISVFIVLILFFQTNNKSVYDNENDLNEWTCNFCGFIVQMGNICTYCYTKKENISFKKK